MSEAGTNKCLGGKLLPLLLKLIEHRVPCSISTLHTSSCLPQVLSVRLCALVRVLLNLRAFTWFGAGRY
jgi:hypothetical protein